MALLIKVLLIEKSVIYRKIKMILDYTFFISDRGQTSALKFAYIFNVIGAQSCLMVA